MATDINATDFHKIAASTAAHFGFQTIDTLKSLTDRDRKLKIEHTISAQDKKSDQLYGLLTSGAVYYADHRLHTIEGPVLFYTFEQVPRSNDTGIALHVFGVEKSIAEAILIQATRSLAHELGLTNASVRINSLGDRESFLRYTRELQSFLKKRIEEMSPAARELMKDHVFLALMHMIEKEEPLGLKAPNPMEHLSDPSRKHFREVVEYLDMSETPYEIDPRLLGHHECFSDTLFAIDFLDANDDLIDDAPLLIKGGRYNAFTEKHLKQNFNGCSALVILKDKKAPARPPRQSTPAHDTVFIAQLGFGPKIKSLLLVDELRRAGIIVQQNLASDSLTAQLLAAEACGAAYTLIIGQKEYVDGTVILRDMGGRNQESVALASVTQKLKRALAQHSKK